MVLPGHQEWHKLCHQRLKKKSIMMFKTGLHGTPEYLRSRFVYRDNVRHLLFEECRK